MTSSPQQSILCVCTCFKGRAFFEECSKLATGVVLLTLEKHLGADWPRETIEEIIAVPEGLTLEHWVNTVTYLARSRHFDRIVALGESDTQVVAHLREHMRISGMGVTTASHFCDRLAMRCEAKRLGFLVPEFTSILNYDDLRAYMASVPAPWVLRSRVGEGGTRTIEEPEQLWRALDELGDRQSYFLLERMVEGSIFHVDAIVFERKVVFSDVSAEPAASALHAAGTLIDKAARTLVDTNARLVPALGMLRGVTHTEFLRSEADGQFYFSEVAAGVGLTADRVEQSCGLNLWREWARIEVAHLRGEPYTQSPRTRA